ncbi:hypothetical protein BLA39750_01057 [Burkholderia lata]|uniref:Uncharacterized protein n=1 Tax=Burkholderia lata (strain ATCC 17760 / DSM 23089 / LMG 22485 / NCIMB 9086 / R18194 / 383) TaxID=482957 RepID=A0A6P2V7Z2_BURL3|nr:hypothetical protein BLA39750_01057 [Burkholderia lata]
MRPAVLVAALLTGGAISATVGAYVGYGKGYERGGLDARQVAMRNMASGVSTLMTNGFSIRLTDGVEKRYILKPVEAQAD